MRKKIYVLKEFFFYTLLVTYELMNLIWLLPLRRTLKKQFIKNFNGKKCKLYLSKENIYNTW